MSLTIFKKILLKIKRFFKEFFFKDKEKSKGLFQKEIKKIPSPPIQEKKVPSVSRGLVFTDKENRLILQVRDPYCIHVYWELGESTKQILKEKFREDIFGNLILRVYDVSGIVFKGDNAYEFFDIKVSPQANNWYIQDLKPSRSWIVDLGIYLEEKIFLTIIRSNMVHTPPSTPSEITDEEWSISKEVFTKLYTLAPQDSSFVFENWQKIRYT